MKNITTEQFKNKTGHELKPIHQTNQILMCRIGNSLEYTVETDEHFFIIDSDGNGSMPEQLFGTVLETEILNELKKFEQ